MTAALHEANSTATKQTVLQERLVHAATVLQYPRQAVQLRNRMSILSTLQGPHKLAELLKV